MIRSVKGSFLVSSKDSHCFVLIRLQISLMFYLFILDRGDGTEKERERNINVWLPVSRLLLGT